MGAHWDKNGGDLRSLCECGVWWESQVSNAWQLMVAFTRVSMSLPGAAENPPHRLRYDRTARWD
jgi:hypothetical protein